MITSSSFLAASNSARGRAPNCASNALNQLKNQTHLDRTRASNPLTPDAELSIKKAKVFVLGPRNDERRLNRELMNHQ